MRIRILRSAFKDLAAGRRFCERQDEGLGDYFLDSLFSDIDSLKLYAGIHRQLFGFHRLLSQRFPYAIYYQIFRRRKRLCSACWTAGAIRRELRRN
jgi:hypothetical protein